MDPRQKNEQQNRIRMPMEHLFICAQSADPYSILVLDPLNGSSRWSLRGAELQQAPIQMAEPLGQNPTHLCVALADKPILYMIPLLRSANKSSTTSHPSIKSLLPHKARFVQAHPCGDFVFVGADNKLFTWEVRSGQLLSLVEEHIRELNAMRISRCGHFLVTASLDGDVKIYLTAGLVAMPENALEAAGQSALASYTPHSMPVTDLYLANGHAAALRVLSTSADHSAVLYSLATRQILLRITADQPLSACCMDPAELRLLLASDTSGTICAVDICFQFKSDFVRFGEAGKKPITRATDKNGPDLPSTSSPLTARFEQQHNAGVLRLSVCGDGTRLASGDREGRYCLWDMMNGQCLWSGKMNGPIAVLSFLPRWPQQQDGDRRPNNRAKVPLVASLQRQMTTRGREMKVALRRGQQEDSNRGAKEEEKAMQQLFHTLIDQINSGTYTPMLECLGGGNQGGGDQGGPSTSTAAPKKVTKAAAVGGKRRRPSVVEDGRDEQLLNGHHEDGEKEQNDDGEEEAGDNLSALSSETLAERVRRLERELARVVQLNAELYAYAAKELVEEERNEGG